MDHLNAGALQQLPKPVEPPRPKPATDFRSRLNPPAEVAPTVAANPVRMMLRQVEADFAAGDRAIDRIVTAAKTGQTIKPVDLLALQGQMQRYNMEFELLSKLVQQLIDIIKTLIKIQV